jgi:hypothetical protein
MYCNKKIAAGKMLRPATVRPRTAAPVRMLSLTPLPSFVQRRVSLLR